MPPRDEGGGATLPCVNGDGVMPLRGDGAMPSSRREPARCWQRWRDAIVIMESWCEANNSCNVMLRQDGEVTGAASRVMLACSLAL
jgi:hypothetical protein